MVFPLAVAVLCVKSRAMFEPVRTQFATLVDIVPANSYYRCVARIICGVRCNVIICKKKDTIVKSISRGAE